jgi:hypothetical protein
MKKLIFSVIFILLLTMSVVPLRGTCYEVGMQVLDSSLNYVSIPIQVYERDGGARVDNGALYSTTGSGGGYNFFIDYNNNCTGSGLIRLNVGTEYVIEFHYPSGAKSLCFIRYGCGEYSYDTFYKVTPTSFTHLSGTCEEDYSYPGCQIIPPVTDLVVSLVIYETTYIGDKITFKLRATASGGNGAYTFSWSNATRTSPTATTNPNTAVRTRLRSQSVTVSVTVTSDAPNSPVTKSIALIDD